MAPMDGHETVFRVQAAVDKYRLHIDPSHPTRLWEVELPSSVWNDLNPSQAEEVVLNGESLLVQGIAGTGKTTFLRGIVERLRSLGKRVDVISKTHVASSRAGGCTADHYVLRHVKHGICTAYYIWIDEYTQIDCNVWVQLNKLTFTGVRWLLSGDPHHFPAILSSYRGCPAADDAFQRSALFHLMSGGIGLL